MFIKLFLILMMLISFSACQSTKDFFTLTKKNQTDEFLIEKKSPLVLPPDYGKLPIPGDNNDNPIDQKDQNIQSIISDNKISTNNEDKKTQSFSIEESILEKINEVD